MDSDLVSEEATILSLLFCHQKILFTQSTALFAVLVKKGTGSLYVDGCSKVHNVLQPIYSLIKNGPNNPSYNTPYHHTKTVMSHSGIFWRQIPGTLSGQIHTMLKPIFTAQQNDFGVYFSDMRKKKTQIHKIKPYFTNFFVNFLNHSYLKWSVHLSSVPFFSVQNGTCSLKIFHIFVNCCPKSWHYLQQLYSECVSLKTCVASTRWLTDSVICNREIKWHVG